MTDHISLFSEIYNTCAWGNNNDVSYSGSSGGGSSVEATVEYTRFVKDFILSHDIHTIADLGCGDWQSSYKIYDELKNVKYAGYDAYKDVIESNKKTFVNPNYSFYHVDIYSNIEHISGADMCILKDILQHWTIDEINSFMKKLVYSGQFKHILITNCCNQQFDNQDDPFRSRPLSAKFLPLKAYNPTILLTSANKEISHILTNSFNSL